ncbi:hypothetical protein FB45DRAFT_921059 [Roridomyces roridus]|uniref:Uncharacterized protein n=1 Tax=Roridomyces roridus TaxID=1738132 RepID=A0AAD7BQQ0_9AGAR|nr:hypothetical protein FB45DRAFT_921059 [Roridomyces roridus]
MTELSPALPQDLEGEIFLLAAYSNPPSVPTLMLVAQRVKAWVEVFRYRVMILYKKNAHHGVPWDKDYPFPDDEEFSHLRSIPPVTLRNSVRHLFIQLLSKEMTKYFLSTCGDLQDLFLYPDGYSSLLDTLGELHLRRFHCDMQLLFSGSDEDLFGPTNIDFTHSLFSNITHLEFFDQVVSTPPLSYWAGLASIPHLTHLSFYEHEFLPLVPQALRDCPNLRVVLFQCTLNELDGEVGLVIPTRDLRFVQMASPDAIEGYTNDWLEGALTGRDFWSRADEHVRKRISGEVTSYVMDGSMELPTVDS